MNIQCENIIKARRNDIVLVEKKEKRCSIIDVAVLADIRCSEVNEISRPDREKRNWQMRSVNELPVVTAVLGSENKKFEKWLEKLQVDANIGVVQKNTTLLGTERILRKVFEQ